MTTVIICSGGPEEEIIDFTPFTESPRTYFIGADRGALHLLKNGIVPDEIIGDFDSMTEIEWEEVRKSIVKKVSKYSPEKDETDTELSLQQALMYQPDNIIITGVTGGRLDHYQSALQLLYRVQTKHKNIQIVIRNKGNEIRLLQPGEYQLQNNPALKYISFFSFDGVVENVTLHGFKYEAAQERIENGVTKFTSNEFASDVCTISFSSGICLMIRGTDL